MPRDQFIRPGIARWLRLPLRRRTLARGDVDRELEFHLEERVRQFIAAGLTPEAARAEALQRFGDVEAARAELAASAVRIQRQRTVIDRMQTFRDDLRYVLRSTRRAPGFALVVIAMLALGIGASVTMFGVIDRLLLRGPDHVQAAGELRRLYRTVQRPSTGEQTYSALGYVAYARLRDQARQIDGVAAYSGRQLVLGRGLAAQPLSVGMATWDFFRVLGAHPALGRFFSEAEDRPPVGERVVVLDHGLWQRRFAGDSAVLGREIHLDAEPYVVIGVSPPGFTGAELERRDAWIPMSLSRNHPEWPTTWNAVWLDVVARLKPGVSADVAAREATQILRRDYPEPNEPEAQALYTWRPISYSGIGREPMQASVSRWLTAVALVVLLIAAANVTNLVLARLIRRRREFAVRLALGVSAGRLTSMVLAESVALALGGAAAGLALAWLAGGIVRQALFPNVVWGAATLDGRLASLAVGLALLTGLIVAVVPAWQARRLDLTHTLKAGSRQAGGDRSRLRATLLMVQCALSVLLVTGAGLFVRSFWKAQHLDLGYEPDAALVADVTWPAREINTQAQRDAWRREVSGTYGAALENVRALPEVRHAALAVGTPFGFGFAVWLRVPGFDSIPRLPGGGPYIQAVTAQYFEATGMRLLGGRTFGSQDHATSERVAIVNATMAQTLWPGEPALGRCLQIFDASRPCARIVGVVGDSRRDALREPAAMQYFVPYGQETGFSGPVLVVRPAGDMRGAALRVQRAVQAIAPAALRVNVFSMREAVDPHVRPWRLGATLFLVFGGLALAIAALGLYSVISYSVAQQAHEFGVRLALGSGTSRIVARVTGRGLLITGVGLLVGLAAALAAGRSIEPQLFETSSRDPLVLTFTVLALLLAALAATALPARRATRVDPVVALRAD